MQELLNNLEPFSDYRGADLRGADLRNSYFASSDFTGANLDGADLRDTYLVNSIFNRASLNGTNFAGADLRDTFFFDTDLTKWKVAGARMDRMWTGPSPAFLPRFLNFTGERITIVGGGPFCPATIDKQSTLVWLNDHWLKWSDDFFCDVLFHNGCTDTRPESFFEKEDYTTLVVANYQNKENYDKWEPNGCRVFPFIMDHFQFQNPFSPQLEWINCLSKHYGFTPSIGVIALEFFRRLPVSEIFVTGITLHQRDDGSFAKHFNVHGTLAHINYLKDVARIDARVKYDAKLKEIIKIENPLLS